MEKKSFFTLVSARLDLGERAAKQTRKAGQADQEADLAGEFGWCFLSRLNES